MSLALQMLQDDCAACMDRIKSHFNDGAKITVLVRSPGYPDRDFCMTDDDLSEIASMVERRRGAALAAATGEG